MKNIVLIGMPASGKSTIGILLAEKIGYGYYDADSYLEEREGMSVKDIFSEKGEKYFRKLEGECLEELSRKEGAVIATGGGAVKEKGNMDNLRKKGITIFIDRKVEDIAREDHSGRPLLQDVNNIYKLYDERIGLYREYADATVENDGTPEEAVNKIIERIR